MSDDRFTPSPNPTVYEVMAVSSPELDVGEVDPHEALDSLTVDSPPRDIAAALIAMRDLLVDSLTP